MRIREAIIICNNTALVHQCRSKLPIFMEL